MTRSKFAWTAVIATILVAAAGLPAWTAGPQPAADDQPAAVAETLPPSQAESCEAQDELPLEEVGGFKIRPTCLGSYPNTCDDYPVPYGGSCSCTSTLIEEKCVNCDNHKEGRVLETTCTICGACYSPPCIPTACINRTSRTCSTF